MNVKFLGYECELKFGKYSNGRTAIELIDILDHDIVAVATVNIPDAYLEKDEVIIKDYSENEGIEDALRVAGVIGEPLRQVRTGMVVCNVCKLLINE